MEFPSITFCNMNALKRTKLKKIKEIQDFMDRFEQLQLNLSQVNDTSFLFDLEHESNKLRDLLISQARSDEQKEFYQGFEVS